MCFDIGSVLAGNTFMCWKRQMNQTDATGLSRVDMLIADISTAIKQRSLKKSDVCRLTGLHINTLRHLHKPKFSPSLAVLRRLETTLFL